MDEAFRRPAGGVPKVLGHRGASARAPENTLRAFSLAIDEGADGVELDVRLLASGELVVFHDPDLARLTGDAGRVRELGLDEVRARSIDGYPIPLLDEALDLVLGRGGLVNVEVKGDEVDRLRTARAVAKLLAARAPVERERILVSTFDPPLFGLLHALGRGVLTGFLFDESHMSRPLVATLELAMSPDAMHPHASLATAESVTTWRGRGRLVVTWTVDEPAEAERVAAAGVDAIITNDPRAIASLVHVG